MNTCRVSYSMRVRASSRTARPPRPGLAPRRRTTPCGLGSLSTSPSARSSAVGSAQCAHDRGGSEVVQRLGHARRGSSVAGCRRIAVQRARRAPPRSRRAGAAAARAPVRRGPVRESRSNRSCTRPRRIAVVRAARRQVEHVAGLEQPLVLGLEVREDLQRHVGAQRRVAPAADAPAAPSRGPAAGTRRRNRSAGRRRRRRWRTRPSGRRAAHRARSGSAAAARARPARAGPRPAPAASSRGCCQRRQGAPRQRAVAQAPAPSCAAPQPRLDVVARRQREQLARAPAARRARAQRLAHQQRLLLPVAAHERRRRQSRPAAARACRRRSGAWW